MARAGRGPELPYKLLAGVEPCAGGWLIIGGRLNGITLTPVEAEVVPTFVDVLDAKPAYTVIALHSPIGLHEEHVPEGRTCDQEARRLLGWPRASAIVRPPARASLEAASFADARSTSKTLDAAAWVRLRKTREVDREMQPYWQRTVFEVNPDLGFFTLNEDMPLRHGKRTATGQSERRGLLLNKIPGIDRVLDARVRGVPRWKLLDAAANLWTARRIASRMIARLPQDPEWDERGLRMELVR
jgi:predicted RNase H-like nuclease